MAVGLATVIPLAILLGMGLLTRTVHQVFGSSGNTLYPRYPIHGYELPETLEENSH